MNPKLLLSMVGRKSATFVSGFCACAWAHSQWPAVFDDASFLLGLAAAALLVVSGVASWKNEAKRQGGDE